LVMQMVVLVLLMRVSKARSVKEPYLNTTAVSLMELMKLVLCCCQMCYASGSVGGGMKSFAASLSNPTEVLKLSVPSVLYMIQNNLLYAALGNLPAATYQVVYQVKILTTAMFSVVLLKKSLSSAQWRSLAVLLAGCALAQSSNATDSHSSEGNVTLGLLCVLSAACTSGFSGVYFEMMLKNSPKVGLWERNVQMGVPSVLFAFLSVAIKDGGKVWEGGFFQGYSSLVFWVITVQAGGGLIVALVVKYADNVVKTFTASLAVVFGSVMSMFVSGFRPNGRFVVGAGCVVSACVMYARAPKGRQKDVLPTTHKVGIEEGEGERLVKVRKQVVG